MKSYQMISFDFLTIINNIPIMWKTKVLYLRNGFFSFKRKWGYLWYNFYLSLHEYWMELNNYQGPLDKIKKRLKMPTLQSKKSFKRPLSEKVKNGYLISFKILPVLIKWVVSAAVNEGDGSADIWQRHSAMHCHLETWRSVMIFD